MRIAYLISEYPAVSHTFIRREVLELRRRGFDVQCFSIRRPKNSETFSELDQLESKSTWYLLPASGPALCKVHFRALIENPVLYARVFRDAMVHRIAGGKGALWAVFHFVEAIYLAEEIRKRDVQRLHNHFSNAAANVGYLVARYLNLAWSLTLHGSADFDGEGRHLLGAKVAESDFVACISYYGRSQTLRYVSPQYWEKIIVYRCGIEPDKYQKRVSREAGPLQFLSVGRLSPEKGHLGLIEAFALVRAKGVDARLTLIGEGAERANLERAIKEMNLDHVIDLPGAANEEAVAEAISRADIFVLSSFMEGLPVVLMEAMASGVPVIAPRVAGIPELIEHGTHGLLFQPSDWEGLARQMVSLGRDRELQRRFSEAGIQRVQGEFRIQEAVTPLAERFRHD